MKRLFLAMMLAVPVNLGAQESPTLAVMIVVDQLRGDLLEHYGPAFTGGFRRLLDEGFHFTQASHAHARTATAPGHSTLTTGVHPARHGIVANSWQQRVNFQWENTYALADPDSPILGFEMEPLLPGRSPANLQRAGLPDWFETADDDSRRVSISRKDRAAIPMGAQGTEFVFWILPELARFITSTHYMDRYPRWLDRFNEREMPDIFGAQVWMSGIPAEYRYLARADTAGFEFDGVHTSFPHLSASENPDDSQAQQYVWASELPYADEAVKALAEVAIDELDLGKRDNVDYLALSFSSTDRVGHQFGPFSPEVFSTLLHLDGLLGELFETLDDEVGPGGWVVGLAGDHGVVTMPEYAQAQGNAEAERLSKKEVLADLSGALNEAVRDGGSPEAVADRLAEAVLALDFIEGAYTHAELAGGAPADSMASFYANSFVEGRAWDDLSRWGVDLRYGEADYVGSPTGTNHETVYWYDRWVPMLFLGAGVTAGSSDEGVYTVDFAPTLAGLLGVPVPDDLDGLRIYP
ncbi:MAG: alkaline phosphatase family protein [Longimicrobiales bacterium]|jgi:predicted AlkP superfamily pyrophosphatase or phosphodiesterase